MVWSKIKILEAPVLELVVSNRDWKRGEEGG
jgi:hypothetical protein